MAKGMLREAQMALPHEKPMSVNASHAQWSAALWYTNYNWDYYMVNPAGIE